MKPKILKQEDMKKLVLLAVCLAGFATAGFAQGGDVIHKGEKGVSSVGGIAGYAIDNRTLVIGVDYRYNLKDWLRLAPSVLHTVKSEDRSAWYVNADAHYPARITDEVTLYPIGGLGLSAWKFDYKKVKTSDEEVSTVKESETKIRAGLNLGFGGEMRVTKDLIIGAEFRYNLTPERIYDQAMLLARAAYYF
jgi:opacity protein-like surface antigen